MKNLMEWHFSVQQGMYFDKRVEAENYIVYSSDIITDGFWNYAFLKNCDSFDSILSLIEKDFKVLHRSPCIYLLDDSYFEQRSKILLKHGYEPLSEESFMLIENNTPEICPKADLIICRVTTDKVATDFIDVFTSAYGGEKTPEQPYGELDKTYIDAISRTFSDNEKFFHYVCYDKEAPVSIATLCFLNGKGGLYNVGTSPSARGKGYGTVASKACIDMWKKLSGSDLFLQTETGSLVEKWYYSLGFKLQFIGRTFTKEIN